MSGIFRIKTSFLYFNVLFEFFGLIFFSFLSMLFISSNNVILTILSIFLIFLIFILLKNLLLKEIVFCNNQITFNWYIFGEKSIKINKIEKVNIVGTIGFLKCTFIFQLEKDYLSRFIYIINGNKITLEQEKEIMKFLKLHKLIK